jgi:aspartyl-tRNA(Asn)/glutamyl-tRNA(Gln) amidotransferase subunit A
LCYATLDTDAIGSCRLPAACCGVVGFKGTCGLISAQGILDGEQPPDDTIRWMAHAGLTTRTAQDTALLLDVLAGPRHSDTAATFLEAVSAERPLRIGVPEHATADPDVSHAFDQAVATIRRLGHLVTDASAPLTDFSKGIATIEADRKAIATVGFKDIDALGLPTTAAATPTVTEAATHPLALSPGLTMFANYYGLPAISVPCGFDRRGLPVALQIVAKPGDDAAVLQLAYQYEKASGHGTPHPIA